MSTTWRDLILIHAFLNLLTVKNVVFGTTNGLSLINLITHSLFSVSLGMLSISVGKVFRLYISQFSVSFVDYSVFVRHQSRVNLKLAVSCCNRVVKW